ncbi:MAG: hypothetical protein ACI81P_003591 [Neolewinella sp.]|jgi:hypothetical protein
MYTPSTVLICVFTLFLSCLTAQTTVGFRVLTGSSSLSSQYDALPANIGKHTRVAGTTFGLVVEQDITYRISLRSGIQQTQRGTTLQQGSIHKLLDTCLPLDYEAQIRTNYLEVPLALKFKLLLAQDRLEVYGWGGVTAGYALTGSIRSRSASSMNFQLMTTKLDMTTYAFPRFHLGYTGGVGLGINLGETLQFRLEADYNRSTEKKAMLSPESGKHGYQSLHLGAGMVFRL